MNKAWCQPVFPRGTTVPGTALALEGRSPVRSQARSCAHQPAPTRPRRRCRSPLLRRRHQCGLGRKHQRKGVKTDYTSEPCADVYICSLNSGAARMLPGVGEVGPQAAGPSSGEGNLKEGTAEECVYIWTEFLQDTSFGFIFSFF
jgi:hypothetical protein